jgi:hypothetical protein
MISLSYPGNGHSNKYLEGEEFPALSAVQTGFLREQMALLKV